MLRKSLQHLAAFVIGGHDDGAGWELFVGAALSRFIHNDEDYSPQESGGIDAEKYLTGKDVCEAPVIRPELQKNMVDCVVSCPVAEQDY